MNAVEIEEAVSELVSQPFEAAEFPFQFLTAFGAKDTTIKRLRKGESNASDVAGGVLQRNNIHTAVAPSGEVGETLAALRSSPKTGSQKVRFLLATDGEMAEAEDLLSGETVACAFPDLARHFGFFLPLAGISTVKEIKNNPIDVKATGRLNRLYVELLKDNPDWGTEAMLDKSTLDAIDPFDRVQLTEVVRVCRRSRSLSEAGRTLFSASRSRRSSSNDADRLRKYLQRYDLSWSTIHSSDGVELR